MITKYNYRMIKDGVVERTPSYSFTEMETLSARLSDVDNVNVMKSIVATTLQGEAERSIIDIEDEWFTIQSTIQSMDSEKASLSDSLVAGDKNGNPLDPAQQSTIKARIADLTAGTTTVVTEFYDHYTRETHKVTENRQTLYTKALEKRASLEEHNKFLSGYRGVAGAPVRPTLEIPADKEKQIKKELVRQQIAVTVGDDKDLIADMSNALSAMVKKISGDALNESENASLNKYVNRQQEISDILSSDYIK